MLYKDLLNENYNCKTFNILNVMKLFAFKRKEKIICMGWKIPLQDVN